MITDFVDLNRFRKRKELEASSSNLNLFVESNNHNQHIVWCVQLRLLMAEHCVGWTNPAIVHLTRNNILYKSIVLPSDSDIWNDAKN